MTNNLEWDPEERNQVIQKILSLPDDQIWDLFQKSEIALVDSFDDVITEIRENGVSSSNLDILLDESKSKQSLLDSIASIQKPTQT